MDTIDKDREEAKIRLQKEIGNIFPHGITDIIFDFCAALDGSKIPKEELENMCKKANLSHTGEKKLLAARLLANEFDLFK